MISINTAIVPATFTSKFSVSSMNVVTGNGVCWESSPPVKYDCGCSDVGFPSASGAPGTVRYFVTENSNSFRSSACVVRPKVPAESPKPVLRMIDARIIEISFRILLFKLCWNIFQGSLFCNHACMEKICE